MFKFPATFGDKYENYITVPDLKLFACDTDGIDFKSDDNRNELIEKIEKYANQSSECEDFVKIWGDRIIKEGIKDIYIRYVETTESTETYLQSPELLYQELDELVYNKNNKHYFGLEGNYESDLKLVKYDSIQEGDVTAICFYFFKYITIVDKLDSKSVIYPIMVDVYLEESVIIARAKSKSNMHLYKADGEDDDMRLSTNVKKELSNATKRVSEILKLRVCQKSKALSKFKHQLYYLLIKYTETPEEIKNIVAGKQRERDQLIAFFMNDVCEIEDTLNQSVSFDVDNMIEKYFSITYPDKEIFIKGKDAYPLKLTSSDEEDSRVQQTSAEDQPLQSRSVFFDNKKMIQENESCDGIYFMFQRKTPKYRGKYFPVKIEANDNYCAVKFPEYVKEEDIDYVLFSIIQAKPES